LLGDTAAITYQMMVSVPKSSHASKSLFARVIVRMVGGQRSGHTYEAEMN
jgi:hypothetical protein